MPQDSRIYKGSERVFSASIIGTVKSFVWRWTMSKKKSFHARVVPVLLRAAGNTQS